MKRDSGSAIHFAVAFVVGGVSMIGFGREYLQHGFHALSFHQLAEALAWPVGAVSALVLGLVVLRIVKGTW